METPGVRKNDQGETDFTLTPPGVAGYFVHESRGIVSMLPIMEADLDNVDSDIWGDQARPWIERLHADTLA
jgi:hypothetical protein